MVKTGEDIWNISDKVITSHFYHFNWFVVKIKSLLVDVVVVAISMKHWVYWRMRPQKFKLICWVNSNFKFILRNILKKKKKSSLKMIKEKNLARTYILISPFHSSFIWDRLFVIPPKELFQYYSSGLAKL